MSADGTLSNGVRHDDITTTSLIELRSLIEHMKCMASAVLPSSERLDTLEALDRIVAELERINQREINK